MMSAASARASIDSRSGAIDTASGETPKNRRSITVASATDVLELLSIATERMSRGSSRVYRATDATGPRDVTAGPGTRTYGWGPRRYSIDGIRPTSIAPPCSSRAHSEGTS